MRSRRGRSRGWDCGSESVLWIDYLVGLGGLDCLGLGASSVDVRVVSTHVGVVLVAHTSVRRGFVIASCFKDLFRPIGVSYGLTWRAAHSASRAEQEMQRACHPWMMPSAFCTHSAHVDMARVIKRPFLSRASCRRHGTKVMLCDSACHVPDLLTGLAFIGVGVVKKVWLTLLRR